MVLRRAVGLAVVLASLSAPGVLGLGACSADDAAQGFSPAEAGFDVGTPLEASPITFGDAGTAVIFGDDANVGAFDGSPSGCTGTALAEDATTTACAIDTSASCPTCAS
jgi:hypothetical protein